MLEGLRKKKGYMKSYEEKEPKERLLVLLRDLGNRHVPKGYESVAEVATQIKNIMNLVWEEHYESILNELEEYSTNTNGRIDYQDLLVESMKFPYETPILRSTDGVEFPEYVSNFKTAINDVGLLDPKHVELVQAGAGMKLSFLGCTGETGSSYNFYFDFVNASYHSLSETSMENSTGIYEIPFTRRYATRLGAKQYLPKRCAILFDEQEYFNIGYFTFSTVSLRIEQLT